MIDELIDEHANFAIYGCIRPSSEGSSTKSEREKMGVDVKAMRTTPAGYFTARWGLPEYTDWIDESMSRKETCYLGDWSFLWERRFWGPDALKLFSDISVNSFCKVRHWSVEARHPLQ